MKDWKKEERRGLVVLATRPQGTAPMCGNEQWNYGPEDLYVCTLADGHEGPHAALDADGKLLPGDLAVWTDEEGIFAPPMTNPHRERAVA